MGQGGAEAAAEAVFTSVQPDRGRAERIDQTLRVRLAASLDYLLAFVDDDVAQALRSLSARLPAGPVSPWVFCLYSQLVAELANGRRPAPGAAEALLKAGNLPAETAPISLRDPSFPSAWWDQYLVLLDTDPDRNFRPIMPPPELAERRRALITDAMRLVADIDPELHAEVRALVRMPVMAVPESDEPQARFGGASTFFMWGATLMNVEVPSSPIAVLDLLVHESSHLLLFGLVEGKALTRNEASERYASPLRTDARPIDGIFHACFVAARVHAAIVRLIETGRLNAADSKEARRHRDYNGNAALNGMASLEAYAQLTERGERIVEVLRAYLEGVERAPATP